MKGKWELSMQACAQHSLAEVAMFSVGAFNLHRPSKGQIAERFAAMTITGAISNGN